MNLETLKYKSVTTIRYIADGLFYPFFSLYLINAGILEAKIGFLLALTPLLAVFLNPLYSKICSSFRVTKNLLGVITCVEGVAIFLISRTTNYNTILIFTIIMAISGCCHYAIMDSLLTVYSDNKGISYSSIRIFGSIAYIVATSVGGTLTNTISYSFVFILATIFFILSGINYFLIKPITLKGGKENEKVDFIRASKALFRNKKFIFFIILDALLSAPLFATNNFYGTYLSEIHNVSSATYGYIYSLLVLFEVITLLVLNKFWKNVKPSIAFVIASVCIAIKIAVCYFNLPLVYQVVFCVFRGIGYGFILHVATVYAVNLSGEKIGTQAVMWLYMLYQIFYAFCNIFGGEIIEYVSYDTFHLISLVLVLLSLVFSIEWAIKDKRKKEIK